MNTENMALVQGWADTRDALRRWSRRPGRVAAARGRSAASRSPCCCSTLTWVVASVSTPDPTRVYFPGLYAPAELGDFGFVLYRNGLVLALHGFACVAGFMAGSSLPQVAEGYSGVWRWIHDKAGPLAIGFVIAATLFSLTTQAYALGSAASDAVGAARHLPGAAADRALAARACRSCSRSSSRSPRGRSPAAARRWNELLAATFVTVAIAIPIVIAAAAVETWVTPGSAALACRVGRGYTF